MKHIKVFEKFLHEKNGFGRDFFHKKKDGKTSRYFFKISGEDETLGFMLNIGKSSRSYSIEGAENSYAVLSVEPMLESVMDDYLVNDSDYKPRRDDKFILGKSQFMEFYKIISEAISDYLENSPKISNIYDEIPMNLEMDINDYMDKSRALMDNWSHGKWSMQEGDSDRTFIYTKRTHN